MIYFISDAHLGSRLVINPRAHEMRLVRWLDQVKADAKAIYMLGDMFDFWFEYRTVVPKGYVRFLGKMAELVDMGIDIHFFTTSNWTGKNIEIKKSDAGLYKLSSPALTIVDIINYQTKLGGINRILSIIEELSEELQGSDLVELINWYPHRSVLQRVGFLLQKLRVNEECQELLFKNLKTSNFFPVLLTPKLNERPGAVNNRWKVDINVKIESDL